MKQLNTIGYSMGYVFEPNTAIANLLHALDELQTRLHDSDLTYRPMWEEAIKKLLLRLNEAFEEKGSDSD